MPQLDSTAFPSHTQGMRLLDQALAFALLSPAGTVVDVHREGNAVQIELETTVNAPVSQVERVLMEVQYWPDWIPHLRKAKTLEVDRRHIVLATEIDLPWPVSDINETVVLERRRLKNGIELAWRHLRGDLVKNEGRWTLLRQGRSQTFVRYEALVQLDTWVPMFMLKNAQEKEAPWVIDGLRKRAQFYASQ
jgi:uncharacterized membrane protein